MSHRHRIEDGSKFRLKDLDPDDTGKFDDKETAEAETRRVVEKLAELHDHFYVDGRRALLIVLQSMDTGGKDGTIKHIFTGINPTGCEVTSFKKPSTEELRHDFLWRITKALPPRAKFGIFNRSHYEDVLVVRVHDLVPKKVWKHRYDHINAFEKRLADEGTVILKFFLHISKDEQKERLEERLKDHHKTWKFDPNDLAERAYWDDYQKAYQDAIRECSAPHAPWYVVPANKKWYRNYVVAHAIVSELSKLSLRIPTPPFDAAKVLSKVRAS